MFQQMGVGVAIALLIDATIIRSVVLPSAMGVLGDWNWYLPRWLAWIRDYEVDGESLGGVALAPLWRRAEVAMRTRVDATAVR